MRSSLAVIGVGNMAKAIISGIITSNASNVLSTIHLFDVNKDQYSSLLSRTVISHNSLDDAVSAADTVLISVKPQNYPEVMNAIKNIPGYDSKLYISIGAGISTDSIRSVLGQVSVIRALPNLPMIIGKGVTAICNSNTVAADDIELVKENIAQTELRAPFDGIIGLRQVSEGAFASTGTIVATLTKITPLKIEFAVPERYTTSVKPGMNLTFSVEGQLERLDAKIYATESKVDLTTHTFPVRALYPNSNGKLFPGRFTNIHLKTLEIPEAIAIPTECIVPEMGVDKVFLYKNGKAQPVSITKGIRNEARVQVLQGLSYGDTIITSGTMQLRTGLAVTLDEVN